MVRNVENVWSLLPPELDEIPDRDRVVDATINLQAFVANVYGCLDNLAWVWVSERDVKNADGTPLIPLDVGLERNKRTVRRSLPEELRNYLGGLDEWIEYIKGFRDSLAHRIPLYIPPFVVHPDRIDEYEQFERDMAAALRARNFEEHERLNEAQKALGTFRPWMVRSLVEAHPVVYHPQLIADFRTVAEIANRIFANLGEPPA